MSKFLLPDTEVILQILITAPLMYLLVIFYVRLIGTRSTSQMNSFDWIVTVAMGAITASTIVLSDITILEGAFSILVLLLLQYCMTWGNQRWAWMRKLMRTTPQLLLFEGEFLKENMKQERILKSEVYAAIRQEGYKNKNSIYAVVLETNAKLSIIHNDKKDGLPFSLSNVQGLPEGLKKDLEERGH